MYVQLCVRDQSRGQERKTVRGNLHFRGTKRQEKQQQPRDRDEVANQADQQQKCARRCSASIQVQAETKRGMKSPFRSDRRRSISKYKKGAANTSVLGLIAILVATRSP